MWLLGRKVIRYDRVRKVEKLFALIEVRNEGPWSLDEVTLVQVPLLLGGTLVVEGA
jgi:hypothetical protein